MASIAVAVVCFLVCAPAWGQQMSPEEQQKKMDEFIGTEVERLEALLKLEDWQVFYVDSILTHDYNAMQAEMNELQSSKVSNYDLYMQARDRWDEKIYNAMNKIFNEEQWEKYLKQGAARSKKARDKRKAKLEGTDGKN